MNHTAIYPGTFDPITLDLIESAVDLVTLVVDVVQVEFKFCHFPSVSWVGSKNQTVGAGSA